DVPGDRAEHRGRSHGSGGAGGREAGDREHAKLESGADGTARRGDVTRGVGCQLCRGDVEAVRRTQDQPLERPHTGEVGNHETQDQDQWAGAQPERPPGVGIHLDQDGEHEYERDDGGGDGERAAPALGHAARSRRAGSARWLTTTGYQTALRHRASMSAAYQPRTVSGWSWSPWPWSWWPPWPSSR